jgi:hypothetical protein
MHGKIDGFVRKCDVHGDHGPLYPCPEYSRETLDEISEKTEMRMACMRSRSWCRRQIEENGATIEGLWIMRLLAGIDDSDWTD